jgi:hypothetical protein
MKLLTTFAGLVLAVLFIVLVLFHGSYLSLKKHLTM